jgi:hypothetical protein
MFNPLDYPFVVLVGSLALFWIAEWIGGSFRGMLPELEGEREEFMFALGGTLTLLGLIIGFSFSMAVNRYDQRKDYEEAEANAIGTEYVRADLLPAADAAKVRSLLKSYLDLRIRTYEAPHGQKLRDLDAETMRLQSQLWSAVATSTASEKSTGQQSVLALLVVGGMNDVLNSEGYTQAAWWNRIPYAAWALMMIISLFCNLMIGYAARRRGMLLYLILPIALSFSLFLIADIDSPRSGIIRVHPQNLESLAGTLHSEAPQK